ncbi:MAG: hypothetical protein AB7R89_15820 [Dehalococcoidia bacterium]
MREARYSDPARRYFDALNEKDQADVTYLVLLLEQNADVDNRLRFWYPQPPLMLRLLDDGEWQIIYGLPDAATILVLSIARKEGP